MVEVLEEAAILRQKAWNEAVHEIAQRFISPSILRRLVVDGGPNAIGHVNGISSDP